MVLTNERQVVNMKGYNQEHLEAVANRNVELCKNDLQKFRTRMFWLGWKEKEIEQMITYLKRKGAI